MTFTIYGCNIGLQFIQYGKIVGGDSLRNLKAEMVRIGITNYDVSRLLGCSEKTVRNKMSGRSQFTISEAEKIRDHFFESLSLEYLFVDSDAVEKSA